NQAARRAVFSLINQHEREGDLAACIELNGRLRKLCGPEFEGEYQDRLGTLWYNQGEYDKALAAYRAAQAEAPTDAQVRRNAALALRQLQRWDEARQALAEALEIDGIGWLHAEQLALVENAEGNAEYQKSHFADAAERYQRATDLAPDDAVYFSNLALASEARPGVGVDGAQAAAAAMETAARLDPKNDEYGQRLQRLRETVRLTPQFGARWLSTSFRADQLVVEVALDLVPFISDAPDEPGLPTDVQSAVDRLRADIAAQYGVTVPPITFKDQLALPDGAYRASFGGVPFMAGSVDVDLRLFTGGLPALEALGVTSSPGLSPLNGRPAHWIEHAEVPKVEAAGLEVWSVVDYVLYDLARVVLKNLKVFIGVEEVSALLKWNATAETAPFLEDPLERSTLTRVLSGLVAEEVTIAPVAVICAAVSSGRAKGDDCTAIIERVRSLPEICQRLPGNWPGQQLLRLSDPLAAMVRKALWRDGNEPVLAIDPGECQEALAAIRTAVQDIDDQPVSIAVSADLRPMVRKLVELEFPNLWVLSEQEVGVDGQTRYIGEVSLT
ncbi:MAG: FHIPEP family type III secretion protein, partial [Acidimicrobiales bacterium]